MLKGLKQFFCSHEWVYGRVATREARQYLKWECYHNRACSKCDKIDDAADRAEQEMNRIVKLRNKINSYPDPIDLRIRLEDQYSDKDEV